MRTAFDLAAALDAAGDPADAQILQRYFKTGPGEYGEGDVFIGVRVPAVRRLVKQARDLPVGEAWVLLESPVHEHRLAALLVLVDRFDRASRPRTRDEVARDDLHAGYLRALAADRVNNWDLIDTSAPTLLGAWLLGPPAQDLVELDRLAASASLWERRAAMLATSAFLRAGDAAPTFRLTEALVDDPEPLIHKATGWMLREVGVRVSRETLTDFLGIHAARMPRTMLSYAVEHLTPQERAHFRSL